MRRHTGALLGVGSLMAGLLALLALLQYRWLAQVAQTIAAQKRETLFRRGSDLADALSRELTRTFHWFQLEELPDATAQAEVLAARWRSWRAAGRHPALVAEVWLIEGHGGGAATSRRLDRESGKLEAADWPDGLAGQLTGRGPRLFGLVAGPGTRGGPVLAVPVSSGRGPGGGPGRLTVLLRLDDRYLAGKLLPALAGRHLGHDEQAEDGGDRSGNEAVQVRLSDPDGRQVFAWPPGSAARAGEHAPIYVAPVRPDLATPDLLAGMAPPRVRPLDGLGGFGLRAALIRGPGPASPLPPPNPPGPVTAPGSRAPGVPGTLADRPPAPSDRRGPDVDFVLADRPPPPPGSLRPGGPPRIAAWQLSLSYAAGPVDALVKGLRQRNLALAFSLLALVAGAFAALALAVRRAHALADRQRRFMASVSHELRTPLAVIGSAAENLRDGTVEARERVREYGALIHGESKRLQGMVDDVLRLAAGRDLEDELRREPLDLRDVVDSAIESFQPELKARGGRIERHEPAEPPLVEADPQALRQALDNVLGNAIKYGGERPAIDVRISRTRGPAGTEVQLAVEDRGLGIPADEVDLVFDPFFRGREALRRQIRGTGLGLALVARVMKAHGGGVTVESAPGRGSRFVLRLPGPPPATEAEGPR